MDDSKPEDPAVVFRQPELPIDGLIPLDARQRVQAWLNTQPADGRSHDLASARLYLHDAETRSRRAARWLRVREIDAQCTNEWGVLMHGGPETSWLLQDASHSLISGLWLASLTCSHAACERHLAGMLLFVEHLLPKTWRTWGLGRLLNSAQDFELLPPDLVSSLATLNEARKASAHFKPPDYEHALLARAQAEAEPDPFHAAERLAETDAFAAYRTVRTLIHRAAWRSRPNA